MGSADRTVVPLTHEGVETCPKHVRNPRNLYAIAARERPLFHGAHALMRITLRTAQCASHTLSSQSANSPSSEGEAYGLRSMSLAMSYPVSQNVSGATRHSSLPVARGRDGHELDEIRTIPAPSSSESRMQAVVVRAEGDDPYDDVACTD